MSNWTHAICYQCWIKREPHREPHRVRTPDPEYCCFCNEPTVSGIYVRQDPADSPCKGQGGPVHHEEDA